MYDDFLPLIVLALGAAMLIGNVLALVRPPLEPREGDLARAPLGRSVAMGLAGLVAAIWGLASLFNG
ncbi:MAG: hypothetical protein GY708_16475 [Actinomycetia bacterium]|nr:hypothetical protein [Actinomycetes bacterium]MCP4962848.1 hypothetical protein [Actinomycetes bacterium]